MAIAAAVGPWAASPVPKNGWPGPVDDMHGDLLRHGVEPKYRVAAPVAAGDAAGSVGHGLIERPAGRLDQPALDLVANAVQADDLAAIDRAMRTNDPDATGLAIDRDLDRDGRIGAQILVAREGKAAPVPLRQGRRLRPAEFAGGPGDDVAGPAVRQMLQAKRDAVDACGFGQFVHEAFDREHVRVRPEPAHRRNTERHLGHEM